MFVLKYKRFTRPQVLHGIGRPLLTQFFDQFRAEILEENLAVPPPTLSDEEWFGAIAKLLSAPEGLPARLAEALYAIDEMASPHGQEQLEVAAAEAGLQLPFNEGTTREDLAMQMWLAAPGLLARLHNQQRLRRLTAFEYFGPARSAGERPAFHEPDEEMLRRLESLLDPWFARHHRGHNTSRIELYRLARKAAVEQPPEFWFLVRHGDTFVRAPKVEEQKTGIIHFRPQRDDVVVYSPGPDELRVNARTRGEGGLYVRAFGLCLRGSEDYFSVRDTYTLEPLRSEGPDALQTEGVPELERIVLRQIELASENGRYVVTHSGEDLFGPLARSAAGPLPHSATLRCAAFDLHFTGCPRPRPLYIRPPNFLKLGRHGDIHVVQRLLCRRGFRRDYQAES
jgi:hypothetical protein